MRGGGLETHTHTYTLQKLCLSKLCVGFSILKAKEMVKEAKRCVDVLIIADCNFKGKLVLRESR